VCCSVSQCVAVCCSVLQCVAPVAMSCPTRDLISSCKGPLNTLQRTTTQCNALQCAAQYYNTMQHTATHCNTLQAAWLVSSSRLTCKGVLQWVAVSCSELQCFVVGCSVLQCVTVCHSVLQCCLFRCRVSHAKVCCSGLQ